MAARSTAAHVVVIAGRPGRLADAIADRLNARGITAALSDLGAGEIRVQSREGQQADVRAKGYGVDVGADANRQIARLLHLVGRIDGLIYLIPPNNGSLVEKVDPDRIGSVFHGAFALIRAAHDAWMRDHGGCVTNVVGAYRYESAESCASTAGASVDDALVLSLTRELAAELSGLVDVNAVVVGPLDAALEAVLGITIKRQISIEAPATEIDAIAEEVIDLQTSRPGSHNGSILVLELA
jgi:hypothetical protein